MTKRPIGKPSGKRCAPFSLRLTFEERVRLEQQAGNMPLSAYIKSLLFAEDAPKYRKRRAAPEADQKLLAELLACLGASRLSNNLNQLAKAANNGSLYVDENIETELKRACADVQAMRDLLMRALGLQPDDGSRPDESLSQSFTRAAAPKPSDDNRPDYRRFHL